MPRCGGSEDKTEVVVQDTAVVEEEEEQAPKDW